ncbi:hypothetical protein ZWY2020_048750 [Hordeum vulgare]|nr:hypothetical protein ZWY2020_048750 [Hordeum vulgare]
MKPVEGAAAGTEMERPSLRDDAEHVGRRGAAWLGRASARRSRIGADLVKEEAATGWRAQLVGGTRRWTASAQSGCEDGACVDGHRSDNWLRGSVAEGGKRWRNGHGAVGVGLGSGSRRARRADPSRGVEATAIWEARGATMREEPRAGEGATAGRQPGCGGDNLQGQPEADMAERGGAEGVVRGRSSARRG